jgi:hypothetical protein
VQLTGRTALDTVNAGGVEIEKEVSAPSTRLVLAMRHARRRLYSAWNRQHPIYRRWCRDSRTRFCIWPLAPTYHALFRPLPAIAHDFGSFERWAAEFSAMGKARLLQQNRPAAEVDRAFPAAG